MIIYISIAASLVLIFFTFLIYKQFQKIKNSKTVDKNFGALTSKDEEKTKFKKVRKWFYLSMLSSSFIFTPFVFAYKGHIANLITYIAALPIVGLLLLLIKKIEIKELEFLKKKPAKIILVSLLGFVVWGLIILAIVDATSLDKLKLLADPPIKE